MHDALRHLEISIYLNILQTLNFELKIFFNGKEPKRLSLASFCSYIKIEVVKQLIHISLKMYLFHTKLSLISKPYLKCEI